MPASLDERYGSVVVNLAPHDLDRPTAEEIVQDVFVHVLQHSASTTTCSSTGVLFRSG